MKRIWSLMIWSSMSDDYESELLCFRRNSQLNVRREGCEVKSTAARNDYILSLSAANAHVLHYYCKDTPELIKVDYLSVPQVLWSLINAWQRRGRMSVCVCGCVSVCVRACLDVCRCVSKYFLFIQSYDQTLVCLKLN